VTIHRPAGLTAGFHAHLQRAGVPGLIHAGDQRAPTSWLITLHSHEVWELYLQLGGPPTQWSMAGEIHEVPARSLLAVPPRVPHAMAASSTAPYHFHFVALDPAAILPPADLHPVWRQRRPFTIADAGSLIPLSELFLREVTSQQPLRLAGLSHSAALLLIEVSRLADGRLADGRPPGRDAAVHPGVAAARQIIRARLADSLTISELAATVHLSAGYLSELFRAETGESPGRYRARLRIERARLLLRETETPVTTIAADLGFSSPQHFATAFRDDTGKTPSQFRKAATDTADG